MMSPPRILFIRMGSYTWKSSWGPKYRQSMVISLGSFVIASLLALRKLLHIQRCYFLAKWNFDFYNKLSARFLSAKIASLMLMRKL